jgi:glycerol-3-phosphate dehydrogenase
MTKKAAPPARKEQLARLQTDSFDLLIIGGGATGAGIALDAATRGLHVALVEANDFASGTSGKSTKLIHGGVRYLERAFTHLDRSQFHLVRDALRERATLLKIAPGLTHKLPLVTPLYSWWQVPYYWIGLKVYDRLSGKRGLGTSRLLSAKTALSMMPSLNPQGLKAAVLFYDGQFDDARMNVRLATDAAVMGAAVANYVKVTKLVHSDGKCVGAAVEDKLSGNQWTIRAKVIINATGPFSDSIRLLDQPNAKRLLTVSAGTHILIDRRHFPSDVGMMIPKTSDGRVLFLLPWEGSLLAGTTEVEAKAVFDPKPTEAEIEFIIEHLNRYLSYPILRSDVKAAWTGLRPLVTGDTKGNSAAITRDHYIEVSDSNLITIVGGKWTTYRKMAEDTVNTAIRIGNLEAEHRCLTPRIRLVDMGPGSKLLVDRLIDQAHLDPITAQHLADSYGNDAWLVVEQIQKYPGKIAEGYPYLMAEAAHAVLREYACTADDILARRTRIALLDEAAAAKATPRMETVIRELKEG